MTLPPLEPAARMGDQVFDVIHSAIMNGTFPAGHPLRIRDLAEELGTSVMPVREAIRRLDELGLVETRPNRSATVKEFTQLEVLDVYQVRRIVEVEAAQDGAGCIATSGVDELVAAYEVLGARVAGRNAAGYLDADEQFLAILYRASGNPVLLEMIRLLWQRCRSYKLVGAGQAMAFEDPDVLLRYQRGLLEAATERNGARAAELTSASLEAAIDRIREGLPTA